MDTLALYSNTPEFSELRIKGYAQKYGAMDMAQILDGIMYSDEYYCNLDTWDQRLTAFRYMSNDLRQWYECLRQVAGTSIASDACLVYAAHQQDPKTLLASLRFIAAQDNCRLFGYNIAGEHRLHLLQPVVVTEHSLLKLQWKINTHIAIYGAKPCVLGHLPAYPLRFDPNAPKAPITELACVNYPGGVPTP